MRLRASHLEEMTLSEASENSGLTAATLRVLLNRRRLHGRKRGRDWFVAPAALAAYLDSRDVRGRQALDPKGRRRR